MIIAGFSGVGKTTFANTRKNVIMKSAEFLSMRSYYG